MTKSGAADIISSVQRTILEALIDDDPRGVGGIAKDADMHATVIIAIKAGIVVPTPAQLQRLAKALDVDPQILVLDIPASKS